MPTQTLDKQVTEEQAAHDEEQQAKDALFDKTNYDDPKLAIPKVDGTQIDRIWIGFTGGFFLDRSDPNDVAFYNKLVFQRDVTLQVDGRCNTVGAQGVTDRDGDLDVVVGRKRIKVHSARISTVDGVILVGTPGADPDDEADEDEQEAQAA
jgi:hypothetical protein